MKKLVNNPSNSKAFGKKSKLLYLGLATCLAVSLTACGGGSKTGTVVSYDISKLKADPTVAAMVPAENKDTLKVGMNIPYTPAEFFDENNKPVGYEVDALNALARVMGVKQLEIIQEDDFDALLPEVNAGTYDMVVSAMTLTKERMRSTNMVSYANAGYVYGAKRGNPKQFDYANPCGFKVGAQAGTSQAEMLQTSSDACVTDGKQPLTIVTDADQDKLVAQVVDGSLDAVIGESPIMKYEEVNNEQFSTVGEILGVAPQGVITAKNNEALAKAVQAGLQKMMDDGTLKEVFKPWGQDSIVLNFATLNPPIM
ncbi:MAG: transporter substrate-binding domain-containing protein [Mobiluncus sp.]|uniref:transporter substrate-binding domain-containing protein n=1 Tax=Mobiluncus sp. TaxID=47293 RepID=UPI002586EB73|nr:transporter substrate-binding domain-containing protein [Mobiluncus sp.]MCI6584524.1 transporter substrate-binding domain-containing protein [Mobiluncus sp.]